MKFSKFLEQELPKPTAVVFGKFNPWTGPKGHGKLVEAARKAMGKDVEIYVVSPYRKDIFKASDFRFIREQREAIIAKGLGISPKKVLEIEGTGRNPGGMLFRLKNEKKIERPVLVVGFDRQEQNSVLTVPFGNGPQEITVDDGTKRTQFEMVVADRTAEATSATKVFDALLRNDVKAFKQMTGYKDDMFNYLQELMAENRANGARY